MDMETIRLMPGTLTAKPHAAIAEVLIPFSVSRPVVIVWGERTFTWHEREAAYCEVFGHVVVEG